MPSSTTTRNFDADVIAFLKATGLRPKRTSVQAPWQNGTAERWVGSCRREILDHVIALNEQHLRRLIREYVSYHHHDRIHDSLAKDTPNRRPVESKPSPAATVISSARLGGLHHRYSWGVGSSNCRLDACSLRSGAERHMNVPWASRSHGQEGTDWLSRPESRVITNRRRHSLRNISSFAFSNPSDTFGIVRIPRNSG